MKKPSRSTILLAIFLSIWAFFEIKDTITGDKKIFFVRWMFSNRGYAKKIEVKPYLLNDEQVLHLLSHPEEEIQQPPQRELYMKNVNVVLRIQNQGHTEPWGSLAYSTNPPYFWDKIDVKIPSMYGKRGKPYFDFVIPIGIEVLFNNDELPPIEVRWISLYTKF